MPVEDLIHLAEQLKDHLLASPPKISAGDQSPARPAANGKRKGKRKAQSQAEAELADAEQVDAFLLCQTSSGGIFMKPDPPLRKP